MVMGHTPKGTLETPKGTVPFGIPLARTLVSSQPYRACLSYPEIFIAFSYCKRLGIGKAGYDEATTCCSQLFVWHVHVLLSFAYACLYTCMQLALSCMPLGIYSTTTHSTYCMVKLAWVWLPIFSSLHVHNYGEGLVHTNPKSLLNLNNINVQMTFTVSAVHITQ